MRKRLRVREREKGGREGRERRERERREREKGVWFAISRAAFGERVLECN